MGNNSQIAIKCLVMHIVLNKRKLEEKQETNTARLTLDMLYGPPTTHRPLSRARSWTLRS